MAGGGRASSAPLLGRDHEPTLFELSRPGRRSASFRTTGIPEWEADDLVPAEHLRPEAVDTVERFVESVQDTLPDDARVIKTIGDEVMIVGSDPAGLTDWAVGFQQLFVGRAMARIGVHYGDALYRDGDYYGRAVNIASRISR